MSKTALDKAQKAKAASILLRQVSEKTRCDALRAIAKALRQQEAEIIAKNKLDMEVAHSSKLSEALKDRLLLTAGRIQGMAQSVESIAEQDAVVGKVVSHSKRADGLVVEKVRIPLGVVAIIFESRPNVVVDCAALAIKSGNAILLKGGKEAAHSNRILGEIVDQAIYDLIPPDSVQVLDSTDRQQMTDLMTLNQYIDVMIPRGGHGLIDFVYENAKMPVIAHFLGLCHTYVHSDADPQMALDIVVNAKASRPGVCNAMETLIVHRGFAATAQVLQALQQEGVELRGDGWVCDNFDGIHPAEDKDWSTEYLDKILSVKSVTGLEEALGHIQTYGSHHTEAIITDSKDVAQKFVAAVDASCVAVNASSRFNDGGQLGLGAELGISTTKLHAYGPMGAEEMTTMRYVVRGSGHVRS